MVCIIILDQRGVFLKNNKIVKISAILVLSSILAYLAVFIYLNKKEEMTNNNLVNVFFYNSVSKIIEAEERLIKKGSNKEMLKLVLDEFLIGPKNSKLSKVIPDNLSIIEVSILNDSNRLKVDFSKEYKELSPIEEITLRSTLVWTLTELEFIKDVDICVEGVSIYPPHNELLVYSNRQNVILNPEIAPSSKIKSITSLLYFKEVGTYKLKSEKRVIKYDANLKKEKFIIQELMLGPKEAGLEKTIPDEIKIRSIEVDESVCFADFSLEFEQKVSQNEEMEKIVIYSIVNSLTQLSDISKVQFLVEGKKVQNYKGKIDISIPIEPDLSMVVEE